MIQHQAGADIYNGIFTRTKSIEIQVVNGQVRNPFPQTNILESDGRRVIGFGIPDLPSGAVSPTGAAVPTPVQMASMYITIGSAQQIVIDEISTRFFTSGDGSERGKFVLFAPIKLDVSECFVTNRATLAGNVNIPVSLLYIEKEQFERWLKMWADKLTTTQREIAGIGCPPGAGGRSY